MHSNFSQWKFHHVIDQMLKHPIGKLFNFLNIRAWDCSIIWMSLMQISKFSLFQMLDLSGDVRRNFDLNASSLTAQGNLNFKSDSSSFSNIVSWYPWEIQEMRSPNAIRRWTFKTSTSYCILARAEAGCIMPCQSCRDEKQLKIHLQETEQKIEKLR